MFTGIDIVVQKLSRLISTIASFFQGDVWINTERDSLLFAGVAVLESPPFATSWRHLQIQTAAVEQSSSFVRRLDALDL